MARTFRRRRFGRRRRFRRRGGFRRRGTRRAIRKLFKKVRRINSSIETKLSAFAVDASTFPSAGAVTVLNNLAVGTALNQRIGNQVKWCNLRGRLQIRGADQYNTVRVMFIKVYKPANQGTTLFTPSYFLQDTSTLIRATWTSPYAWNQRNEFRVLYDRSWNLQDPDSSVGPYVYNGLPYMKNIKIKLRLGFKTTYAANTATSTDISDNMLLFWVWGDSAVIPTPDFSYYFRLTYKDA